MASLGIAGFMRNLRHSLIGSFLVAGVLLIFCFVSALLEYQYDKFAVLQPYMQGDGIFFQPYITVSVSGLTEQMQGISDSFQMGYYPYYFTKQHASQPSEDEDCSIFLYDDKVLEQYTPQLERGIWLDEVGELEGVIPCVITENLMGYDVGDVISLRVFKNENPYFLRALVVGRIREGAEILGGSVGNYSITDRDYSCFYKTYSYERTGESVVMLRKKDAEQMGIGTAGFDKVLFAFDPEISQEDMEANVALLEKNGHCVDMKEFRGKSYETFFEECRTYVPMAVAVLTTVLVTLIVLSAVNYKQNIQVLSVYYTCGMSRGSCVMLEALSGLCVCVMGALLAAIGYMVCKTCFGSVLFLRFGSLQLQIAGLLLFITLLIYALTPAVMMFRLSPAEAVRKRGMMG